MAPAFHSTGRAAALGILLVFLLTLPVTLHSIGGVPLEEAYRGVSERAGSFDYFRSLIFEDRSDVDILFCGNSLLGNGVDIAMVQRQLSKSLGRQAAVFELRQSWQGPDMNYFVTRDFMEHRKVKLLVIAAPARVHFSSQPHVQIFRVIRYGDHPGALDGLPLGSQLALYGDYVLGAPRQALNLLRPNEPDPPTTNHTTRGPAVGYRGRPFVKHNVEVPPIPPDSLILSRDNRELFQFDGPPLNAYQLHFLRKTAELARQHHTLLVILHMPSPSERGMQTIPDRQLMPEVLGAGVAFAGVPSARMFAKVPGDQFEDYFEDEHLGMNGYELFTGIITPALIQLYEHHSESR